MNSTTRTSLISISERVYRALLILYPIQYRREYGALMVQVFRDMCRDTYSRRGSAGIALWWCTTLLDLTLTAIEQRRKVRYTVSRSTLIQLTGILLIVGGVCGAVSAYSQLQPGSHYTYYGIYQIAIYLLMPAYLMIGMGNFGVALRYGAATGQIGRLALIASGLGGLLTALGLILSGANDSLWQMTMIGLYIYTIGGIVFGLINLRANALPVFRGLPLVGGAIPLLMIFGVFRFSSDGGADVVSFAWIVLMSVIWLVIGVAIQRQPQPLTLGAAT